MNPVSVPVGSGWIAVNFPLSASALTGGTVNTILTNVTEIRLLHRSTPGTTGDPIAAQLGVATSSPTEVDNNPSEAPQTFHLYQNYPNPFNPTTMINYELSANTLVTLKVYNVLGKDVAILVNAEMEAEGTHRVQFNASGLTSGIYFYRLEAGTNTQVKQLAFIK